MGNPNFDRVEEVLEQIGGEIEADPRNATMEVALGMLQARATLALAYEQRTANLIEYTYIRPSLASEYRDEGGDHLDEIGRRL